MAFLRSEAKTFKALWAKGLGLDVVVLVSSLCVNGWKFPSDRRDSWDTRAAGTFRTQLGAPGNVVRSCFSLGGLLGFLNALHECRRCRVVSLCLLALQSFCQGCQVWLPGHSSPSPGTAGVSSPAPCTWLSRDITQQERQKMSERLQLLQK